MRSWIIACANIWMLIPVLGSLLYPEWAENALEDYLDKYLQRKNELKGFNDPEMYMDVPELVRSRGYPIDVHEVFTEDGYRLTLHRISGKKDNGTSSSRPVVFFQHGLRQSSACWLLSPVDKALPYVLADRGYDVWLGNFRGSTYSMQHVNYTGKDYKFWNFSWDDMATFDLPAMLKFVLGKTSKKELTFVGHSLGCAVFFAFADAYPELQSSVNLMVGLGPASANSNTRAPIRRLAPYIPQLEFLFRILGIGEFIPNSNLVRFIIQALCTKNKAKPRKCENLGFILGNFDPANFNSTLLPVINRHYPAGTSVRTVVQLAQGISSKRFQKYDWGRRGNQERYGQDTPPEYSLTNVKVPVVLFYGENDLTIVPKDVEILASRLGNVKGVHRVPMDQFSHMDFLFARDIDTLLNHDVRKVIEAYNPPSLS